MAEVIGEVRRHAEQMDHPSATLTTCDIVVDIRMLTPTQLNTARVA